MIKKYYLNSALFLKKYDFWVQIILQLVLLVLVIVGCAFSVFDLIDKLKLISTSQLNSKIALIILFGICLVAITIALMLTLMEHNSVYLVTGISFLLMLISFLGFGGVLVPGVLDTLEISAIKLKDLLLGLAIVFLCCFSFSLYLSCTKITKKNRF